MRYWRTVSEQYRRHSVKEALDVDQFCIGAGLTDPTSGILERSSAMRAAFFNLGGFGFRSGWAKIMFKQTRLTILCASPMTSFWPIGS